MGQLSRVWKIGDLDWRGEGPICSSVCMPEGKAPHSILGSAPTQTLQPTSATPPATPSLPVTSPLAAGLVPESPGRIINEGLMRFPKSTEKSMGLGAPAAAAQSRGGGWRVEERASRHLSQGAWGLTWTEDPRWNPGGWGQRQWLRWLLRRSQVGLPSSGYGDS